MLPKGAGGQSVNDRLETARSLGYGLSRREERLLSCLEKLSIGEAREVTASNDAVWC